MSAQDGYDIGGDFLRSIARRDDLCEEISDLVKQLNRGWREKVHYRINITLKNEMGVTTEERAKTVAHPGLLAQLKEFEQNGDNGPRDGAERSAPNKPGSRPPGNMRGFHLLDEISVEVIRFTEDCYLNLSGPAENALCSVDELLDQLQRMAFNYADTQPEMVEEIRVRLRKWVRTCRLALSHDLRETMLADTVCGECGGALAVGKGEVTDVRCIGTPEAPSCGLRYKREDWLALLEAQNESVG
ncbi:hypothetical protein [Streptomyces microflavus]|uniref:hypothetical protein n=1 Tax=Streptomyces microflavus TaxID=1919 RepID=UPI00367E7A82